MPTPGQSTIEQKMQLRATEEWISAAPRDVIFVRSETSRDTLERGGLVRERTYELDPQRVRIDHAPPRRRRLENSPPNPTFEELSYGKDTLVGMPDLDVQIGDIFTTDEGVEYLVLYVFQDRSYQTIANIGTGSQIHGSR